MRQSATLHRLLGLIGLHDEAQTVQQVMSGEKRAYLGTIIATLHARRSRFQRALAKTSPRDHRRLDQITEQIAICDELIALAPAEDRARHAQHLREIAEQGAAAARRCPTQLSGASP